MKLSSFNGSQTDGSKEEEKKGRGGGMYDLTAHPNEYITTSFGALGVPPELRHYGSGGAAPLFYPADGRH